MTLVTLEYLFPAPSLPKSSLLPSHFPGISPQSTEELQEVLKDNHIKWHIFFNDKHFHNHAAHRAIAAWALGAESSTIKSGYEKDCGYEKPAFVSPKPDITAENFEEHLGDELYYSAYIKFFSEYVKENGMPQALEEFIFSRKANLGAGSNSRYPWMLSRFLSGVLHPLIHTGYGTEFNLPGMTVEGLAMTAVHLCPSELLTRLNLFEDTVHHPFHHPARSALETVDIGLNATVSFVENILSLSLKMEPGSDNSPIIPTTQQTKTHALSILSRVLNDPQFTPSSPPNENDNIFEETIRQHSKAIAAFTNQWDVHEANIDKKIEELVWTVSVLYGVGGWTDGKDRTEHAEHDFNADFFFMHLVTSSIFLPAICALLLPASQVRLLKSYLHVILIWAVARGQPALDIKGFMLEMSMLEETALLESVKETKSVDLWMRIIEEARGHHDEHLTKMVRSLAAWASAFGLRKARVDPAEVITHAAAVKGASLGGTGVVGIECITDCNCGSCTDLHPRAWRDSKNGFEHENDPHSASHKDDENVFPRTELPGSEYLNGGLFLRIAVLTLGRMGWDKDGVKKPNWKRKEGQRLEEDFWDFKGFFGQDKHHEVKNVEKRLMSRN